MTPLTLELEVALAYYFKYTKNIIVPNVKFGMLIHECDLLIMTKSGYLYEVEIKRTKQDLLADLKKEHGHFDKRIKYFYFAIPGSLLETCEEFIPKRAGIITVVNRCCHLIREPKNLSNYKCSTEERLKLLRLGTLRIWSLKSRIIKLKRRMR
jgi:hypothetical protein